MRKKDETIRLLGKHYRELDAVEALIPIDMAVLLLRMALAEVGRSSHGAAQPPKVARDAS